MASSPVTDHEHTLTKTSATTTGWGLFRGALVVAVVLLLVGALSWIIFGYSTDHFVSSDAKRVLERQKILADRTAEDAKLLHDPAGWLAKDKGIVRVPIDRAMEMTVKELEPIQPHPAYPVKQSPPQPANAPTAADKGAGVPEASAGVNPPASNPTVGQPSPAPAAAAVPAPTAAPTAPATPAPTVAPTPASTATPAPIPVPTATPPPTPVATPAPTAEPTAKPVPAAPVPATGAQPEPVMTPPSQPTPTGTATPSTAEKTTPSPSVTEPGANPAGTP